jgi:hypothetical protein
MNDQMEPLEANMGTVTDEEWRRNHHETLRLILPPEEFAYHWEPDEQADNLLNPTPEDTPDD